MKKYFAVKDPCSGKEALYQVVHGEHGQGFDIVAAGPNIGALVDSIMNHVEKTGGTGIDIYIKPPTDAFWVDVKPQADSKAEVEETDVVMHQTIRIDRGKMNQFIAKLHEKTKDKDYMFMFYR
ncbi:hypothetical protein KY349_02245 [Candidatus Woesearchaeota archaeon]|nr:hypothetical protein [Candidatus Woesearchaeota archaeon]